MKPYLKTLFKKGFRSIVIPNVFLIIVYVTTNCTVIILKTTTKRRKLNRHVNFNNDVILSFLKTLLVFFPYSNVFVK